MSSKKQLGQQRPTPEHLRHLEISLAPFTANGKTFRVIGTETERMECRFDTNGLPEIVTVKEHRHRVLCVETDERWWMPHERVKNALSLADENK
jgi:hypothetical protein